MSRFIGMGQSNWGGRGLRSELVDYDQFRSLCELIKFQTNDSYTADHLWGVTKCYAGYEIHPVTGHLIGNELTLGQLLGAGWLQENYAVGNTGMEAWIPGGAQYDAALLKFSDFQKELADAGRLTPVRAIGWCQGEFDSRTLTDANAYQARFQLWVDGVRNDFANVPIIVVETSPHLPVGDYPHVGIVRQAQKDVAAANTNMETIDTSDLGRYPMRSDELYHFDHTAQLNIGTDIHTLGASLGVF